MIFLLTPTGQISVTFCYAKEENSSVPSFHFQRLIIDQIKHHNDASSQS